MGRGRKCRRNRQGEDRKGLVMHKLRSLDLNLYISDSQSMPCIPLPVPKIFSYGSIKSNNFHLNTNMLFVFFIVLIFAVVGKIASTFSRNHDSGTKLCKERLYSSPLHTHNFKKNRTKILHKNVLDDAIKIIIFIKSQLSSR